MRRSSTLSKKKTGTRKKAKDCRVSCDELNRLNENLIRLNQKLIDAELMKSNFISNISNEIINPFTSILALSKGILEVKKENWKKVIAMVAMIHSEAFTLDFQLKNIFAAAKIEAGEIFPEISDVDVKGLILDVIDSFKYEVRKKSLLVKCRFTNKEFGNRYYFHSDSEKIRLIVSNLLSNAIKFSHVKGKVLVNTLLKDDKLTLSIQDFGEGISKKNQQTIFDRFNRTDSGISSAFRGHGLGLSINKAFIDMLHGKFELRTAQEKGSKFIVTLPRLEGKIEGTTLDGNELLFREDLF